MLVPHNVQLVIQRMVLCLLDLFAVIQIRESLRSMRGNVCLAKSGSLGAQSVI